MDLKPNMANFPPTVGHFFVWQTKVSEFTTENSFCEFGFFFCPPPPNVIRWEKSSPCWVSGPLKIIHIGPYREWQKARVSLVCFCL